MPHPVPEETPGDKANAPLNHPVQEENPKDKSITPLPHPVQEESPADKSNASLSSPVQEQFPKGKENTSLGRPIQEESPPEEKNASLPQPVQEESPSEKGSSSLASPVQETSPTGKANAALSSQVQEESPSEKANPSLASPVQEESPTEKGDLSLPHPVQEKSCTAKANTSLPYSVPEDKPAQKPDGEAGPSRSSAGERATEGIRPEVVDNTATRTVGLVRNDNAEEAIASSNAVGAAEDSRTVSNSEAFDKTGAFRAKSSGTTSFKPGAALGPSWQGTIRSGNQGRANPMTRSVPKKVKERLLQEASNSPSSKALDLDELCAMPESQKWSGEVESQSGKRHGQWAVAVTKGKNAGSSDVAIHRVPMAKGSGPSMLFSIPDKPKSDAQPNAGDCVSQNPASSNVGACNKPSLDGTACGSNSLSQCARSSSFSKESSHRKALHSKEDVIHDGPLPAGTVSNGNEAMRAARNGEAVRPGYHAQDEHSPDSRESLSSETQPSADGDTTVIRLEAANPEDDFEGKKRCDDSCRFM